MEFTKLPNNFYEKELEKVIANNLKCSEYEIECSAGSSKGDNFLGIIYRIVVKSKESKLNLILKVPPQNATRREQCDSRIFFLRESEFYENICAIYQNFQAEKGIEVAKEGFYEIPFCFKSITEEPFEGLFFEDLKENQFELFNGKIGLSREHVILVVKAHAKMHALFFALKDQKQEAIEKYRKLNDTFSNSYSDKSAITYSWLSAQIELATKLIEKQKDGEFKEKALKVLRRDFFEQFDELVNGNNAEPYAVVCHGDCWNNNIMFRYNENGIPIDTKLLDFQIVRYSSPVVDFAYFIFSCTLKSVRDKYYGEFVDVYYNTLSSFIERLGSIPQKVFPREAFDDQLKKFAKLGLLMSILVIPTCTSDAADIPSLDDQCDKFGVSSAKFDNKSFNYVSKSTYSLYEDRMLGVFRDMVDLEYI